MPDELKDLRSSLFEAEFPDPTRLVELAPALPREAIPAAIDFALRLKPTDDRDKLLCVLVVLADSLPKPLLRRAIAAIRNSRDNDHRLDVLATLALQFSGDEQEELLAELVEDATIDLLENLAPHLTVHLLKRAVEVVRRRILADRYVFASELIRLLPFVQKTKQFEIIDEALAAVRSNLDENYGGIVALVDWASQVPNRRKREALEIAQQLPNSRGRFLTLSRLIPHLPPPERRTAIQGALAAAIELDSLGDLKEIASQAEYLAIANLKRLLTVIQVLGERIDNQAQLMKAEFWVPLAITNVGYHKADILQLLAPRLPGELIPQALAIAWTIKQAGPRARAMAALASSPTAGQPILLKECIELARTVTDARERSQVVQLAAPKLGRQQQRLIFAETLDAVREMEFSNEENKEWHLLGDIITTMAGLGHWKLALLEARKLTHPTARSRVLYDIAPNAPESQRDLLLKEALDVASTSRGISGVYQAAPAILRALYYIAPGIPEAARLLKAQRIAIPKEFQWGGEGPNEVRDPGEPWRMAIANLSGEAQSAFWSALQTRLGDYRPGDNERIVSTGFAERSTPELPLPKSALLQSDYDYYFWFEIGDPVEESIEETPIPIPAKELPEDATLTVMIWSATEGLQVGAEADTGEVQLMPDGSVAVVRQPGAAPTALPSLPESKPDKRLHFPLRTPKREGTVQLLCNIYYKQILLQSRLVQAEVGADPLAWPAGLRSRVVYRLSKTLAPSQLAGFQKHDFSLSLAEFEDGRTSFSFWGAGDAELIKGSAAIDSGKVQDLIEQARNGLRLASWDDDKPWAKKRKLTYRYETMADLKQFQKDMVRLAIRGYRFFRTVIGLLAPDPEQRKAFVELMRRPGLIQLANGSPRLLIPAALIYDYDFDTNASPDSYSLCPTFLEAMSADGPLESSECFLGECPSRGKASVICPSGFWGYRHRLGMPITSNRNIPSQLSYVSYPKMFIGVWTGDDFKLRQHHEAKLKALCSSPEFWERADSRQRTFDLLKTMQPHLVYFYCHGGWDASEKIPFILVGQDGERAITPDNLGGMGISWQGRRPLVFINGCHTTALEPDKAIEFVTAFIEDANAAGVIGTDVTIFEGLASTFAEECLQRFLTGSEIGDAVRAARVALLKKRNPLGLAYIPYVIATLRLEELR